jgi:hypothetical protein
MSKRTVIQLGAAVLGGVALGVLVAGTVQPHVGEWPGLGAGVLAGVGGGGVLFALAGSWVDHNPLP